MLAQRQRRWSNIKTTLRQHGLVYLAGQELLALQTQESASEYMQMQQAVSAHL